MWLPTSNHVNFLEESLKTWSLIFLDQLGRTFICWKHFTFASISLWNKIWDKCWHLVPLVPSHLEIFFIEIQALLKQTLNMSVIGFSYTLCLYATIKFMSPSPIHSKCFELYLWCKYLIMGLICLTWVLALSKLHRNTP